jgi:ABC-type Fe3+/spermidine/putrescine transport system ATPase subunit
MQTELAKLVADVGITTVFVTHDQEEAMAMSDRIAVMDRGVIAQHATPREIYDYPATSFVADFVGTSNLLSGTVETAGDRFRFDGGTLPLPDKAAPGAARVMIRPEHLVVADATQPSQVATGLIEFVRPVGESVLYDVRLPSGLRLTARAPRKRGRAVFEEGSSVSVALATEDACWVIPERAA